MSTLHLFDTNFLIYLFDGEDEAIRLLFEAVPRKHRFISSITRHEVMVGDYSAKDRDVFSEVDEAIWQAINENFTTVPISAEIERLAAQYRRQNGGKAPDAIIAATGASLKAKIVTRNIKDFRNYLYGVIPS